MENPENFKRTGHGTFGGGNAIPDVRDQENLRIDMERKTMENGTLWMGRTSTGSGKSTKDTKETETESKLDFE